MFIHIPHIYIGVVNANNGEILGQVVGSVEQYFGDPASVVSVERVQEQRLREHPDLDGVVHSTYSSTRTVAITVAIPSHGSIYICMIFTDITKCP